MNHEKREVDIDLRKWKMLFASCEAAHKPGTTMVYQENSHMIEEDPKSFKESVLKNLMQEKIY